MAAVLVVVRELAKVAHSQWSPMKVVGGSVYSRTMAIVKVYVHGASGRPTSNCFVA